MFVSPLSRVVFLPWILSAIPLCLFEAGIATMLPLSYSSLLGAHCSKNSRKLTLVNRACSEATPPWQWPQWRKTGVRHVFPGWLSLVDEISGGSSTSAALVPISPNCSANLQPSCRREVGASEDKSEIISKEDEIRKPGMCTGRFSSCSEIY